MRQIPDHVIRAGSTSPDAVLPFLTIEHRALAEPIRVVCDVMDYMVDGVLYKGCPFETTTLPDNESAPRVQLRVQNVDRRIGEALRAISDRARVLIEVRSSADFDLSQDPRVMIDDAPVYSASHLELIDVTVTPIDVTGTVFLRDFSQEPFPGVRATQSRCPGLFR